MRSGGQVYSHERRQDGRLDCAPLRKVSPMYHANNFNRLFAIGITIVSLAGTSAFADRRDQDDHRDRSSQSSRSSGGGGDLSSRSVPSGQSSSNSGAAIRSFSSR